MTDRSVLLVEDEPLILMDLEFAVTDRGWQPRTASGVRKAMEFLEKDAAIAAAVLDITLKNGENCLPIARELERRRIPYVLHSGELEHYSADMDDLTGERVAKPASAASVVAKALAGLAGDAG